MQEYKYTAYLELRVLVRRAYIKKEWCIYLKKNAVKSELQEHNRHRFWASIVELEGGYSRVITLEDRVTIHNAFLDRKFKP